MTDRPRIIPATARVTKPRKPTRRQRLAQLRAAQAWQQLVEADESGSGDRPKSRQLTGPEIAARRDTIKQRLAMMDEARMSAAARTLEEDDGS